MFETEITNNQITINQNKRHKSSNGIHFLLLLTTYHFLLPKCTYLLLYYYATTNTTKPVYR